MALAGVPSTSQRTVPLCATMLRSVIALRRVSTYERVNRNAVRAWNNPAYSTPTLPFILTSVSQMDATEMIKMQAP